MNTDKFLTVLKDFSTRVGQTIEFLWPHALRYIVVDAIGTMIASTAAIIVILLLRKSLEERFRTVTTHEEYEVTMIIVDFMAYLIVLIIACATLSNKIPEILEPTGYLLNQALERVK